MCFAWYRTDFARDSAQNLGQKAWNWYQIWADARSLRKTKSRRPISGGALGRQQSFAWLLFKQVSLIETKQIYQVYIQQ